MKIDSIRDALLDRLDDQAVFWLGSPFAELLQALKMQVERLAAIAEGFAQRLSTGDDVGNIGIIHDIRGVLRPPCGLTIVSTPVRSS
jgi:hypothetical protein